MPPSKPHATRQVVGGRGPRYVAHDETPTGRGRSAPIWSASAALIFKRTLEKERGGTPRETFVAGLLQSFEERTKFGQRMRAGSGMAPGKDAAATCLEFQARRVDREPARAKYWAHEMLARVRASAGSAELAEPRPLAVAPEPPSEADIATARAQRPWRPRPPVSDRTAALLESLRLDRLESVSPEVRIAPERARQRLYRWMARHPHTSLPPVQLVQSLLGAGRRPTAVAQPGDHLVDPTTGAAEPVGELLVHMGVKPSSPRFMAYAHGRPQTEREVVRSIGLGVHAACAAQILREAREWAGDRWPRSTLRYASACSALDLFAEGLDAVAGPGAWEYVLASERHEKRRSLLIRGYASAGLTEGRARRDAASPEATTGAPYADVWFMGSNCGVWSKRNHWRTSERMLEEMVQIDRYMEYVHAQRPLVAIVENVDTVEAEIAFTASVRALESYEVRTYRVRVAGQTRDRLFWVCLRQD